MRRLIFIIALASAAFLTPRAHAQLSGDPMNNIVCPADFSYSQCVAAGYTTMSGSGSGSSSSSCGKATSLESCYNICECQYQATVKKKCGKGPAVACRDLYSDERSACQGHCLTDWS
jgi:hypothetical protein